MFLVEIHGIYIIYGKNMSAFMFAYNMCSRLDGVFGLPFFDVRFCFLPKYFSMVLFVWSFFPPSLKKSLSKNGLSKMKKSTAKAAKKCPVRRSLFLRFFFCLIQIQTKMNGLIGKLTIAITRFEM